MKTARPIPPGGDYILGLDLGANSVGWAVLDAVWQPRREGETFVEGAEDPDGTWVPVAIRAAGSRVFEAAVEGDLDAGKEESRNKARRMARGARRSGDRRRRRIQRLYSELQRAGLLPAPAPGVLSREERRDAALKALDRDLLARWTARWKSEGVETERLDALPHVLPYVLRAHGLDHRLELHELGRALYHLGQRRGFLSNRKAPEKKDDDAGAVKQSIADLRSRMEATGSRTYGELFSKLNPANPDTERIRGRFTARSMFEEEFKMLWTRQALEHPSVLTDDLHKVLHYAIFHQRPLKSSKHLIGYCELERHRQRAPIACEEFQRFRVLQKINDIRVWLPAEERGRLVWRGGSKDAAILTPDERTKALHAFEFDLDQHGNLSITKLKKALGLPKDAKLNFEVGEEADKRTFSGFRTRTTLRRCFGNRWDQLTPSQQRQAYLDVQSIRSEEALAAAGKRRYALTDEQALVFSKLSFEPDYAMLSRQALRNLLPLMEQGVPYMTAKEQVYGPPKPLPQGDQLLPVLDKRLGLAQELRNPVVTRSLTEVRKVVNALIREYGKPAIIRMEFGRELKRSKKDRIAMDKLNRENEKSRKAAIRKILTEALPGATEEMLRRADIERTLLWEECGGVCPYTGTSIPFAELFGQASRFDVEHIIPFSKSLDDSFLNKTLCLAEHNRKIKVNRTPWQAYSGNPTQYDEILARVQRFKGDPNRVRAKMDRFAATDDDVQARYGSEFASRQLNDTRYVAKLGKRYLGQLYGCDARGIDPRTNRMVITVGQGKVTQFLRERWQLGGILGGGTMSDWGTKNRGDHRHHAVDAIAIACTDAKTMKRLSDFASKGEQVSHRWWKGDPFPVPFDGFLSQAQDVIDRVVVSHRVSRKVSGPLHDETNYSPPTLRDGKTVVARRKPVHALSENMLKDIVDDAVRKAVIAKWEEVGKDFKKLEHQRPVLVNHNGEVTPIKSVRVRTVATPMELGTGPRKKWVLSGSNHHMEIVEITDKKGQLKWEGHLVNLAEAYERRRRGEPVVKLDHGPGKRFVCSIAPGDMFAILREDGSASICRIRTISGVNLEYVTERDARMKKDIKNSGDWKKIAVGELKKRSFRKVQLDVLGRVRFDHA